MLIPPPGAFVRLVLHLGIIALIMNAFDTTFWRAFVCWILACLAWKLGKILLAVLRGGLHIQTMSQTFERGRKPEFDWVDDILNDPIKFDEFLDRMRHQARSGNVYTMPQRSGTACYETLGIEPAATVAEIKSAYRTRVKLYHPDTAPDGTGDSAKVDSLTKAYDEAIRRAGLKQASG